MTTYLGRLKTSREIVGIFTVEDDDELYWLVDECVDPALVEIAELGTGGIIWNLPGAATLPLKERHDDESIAFPSGASFTGAWAEQFFLDVPAERWRSVPKDR